jgi:hypothetical protein
VESRQTDPFRVSVLNFCRAESDTYFAKLQDDAGGVNTWHHFRTPAPIDEQNVIRLNRDTLYSVCIANIGQGATLIMPDSAGRYQTVMIINQDHYINRVFEAPGEYSLTTQELGSPYVLVAARTFVDPNDPADLQAVAALQDQLRIVAQSDRPFTRPAYDAESLTATRAALLELARGLEGFGNAFGSKEQVDPIMHLLGTAAGWGGLPKEQAMYLNMEPRLPVGHYTLTVGNVPVGAFWSISVYNPEGYFEKNALGRYTVNSVTAQRNPDGTATINFGGDPANPNMIPIMDGWNYMVRLYRPGPALLNGSWSFPVIDQAAA